MRIFLLACAVFASGLPAQQLVWEVRGVQNQYTFGPYSQSNSGQMADLGDMDGDGTDDLLVVGANLIVQRSQLWILSGADGSTLRTVPGVGQQLSYYAITAAGDMNGDGTPDYAVAIWDISVAGTTNTMEVRSGADDSVLWQKRGDRYAQFGSALAGNLDLDGDGRPDLALTVPNADNQRLGAVYAYRNDGTLLWQRFGTTELPVGMQTRMETIDRVGDVDGDGADDVLVGGYDARVPAGAGVVLSGRTGKILVEGLGPTSGPIIGVQVAGLGDIDGDGVPDFAAGADYASLIMAFSGRTGAPLYTWTGAQTQTINLSISLASRVDLDQDGVLDLVAGSRGAQAPVLGFSGRDGTEILRFMAPPTQFNGQFGLTVETLRPQGGNPFPLVIGVEPQYGPYVGASSYQGRILAYRSAPPTVQPLGTSCRGTLTQAPRIGMQSLGTSGARVHLSAAPPGAPALLLLGLSTTMWQGTPLPLSLTSAGFPGCTLYTSIEATAPVTAGTSGSSAGYAYFDVPVPLAIGPSRATLHGQWLVFGSGATWPGALSAVLTWQH